MKTKLVFTQNNCGAASTCAVCGLPYANPEIPIGIFIEIEDENRPICTPCIKKLNERALRASDRIYDAIQKIEDSGMVLTEQGYLSIIEAYASIDLSVEVPDVS